MSQFSLRGDLWYAPRGEFVLRLKAGEGSKEGRREGRYISLSQRLLLKRGKESSSLLRFYPGTWAEYIRKLSTDSQKRSWLLNYTGDEEYIILFRRLCTGEGRMEPRYMFTFYPERRSEHYVKAVQRVLWSVVACTTLREMGSRLSCVKNYN